MKKILLSGLVGLALLTTSCGSDDDNNNCSTCTNEILGIEIVADYCDNGDGTINVTIEGETETVDLPDGISFSDFISQQEGAGAECN